MLGTEYWEYQRLVQILDIFVYHKFGRIAKFIDLKLPAAASNS
jgi:hypothetical protein